jgi:hypothetical protein
MEELRGVIAELLREKSETQRQVERRKVRIEQLEKKVCSCLPHPSFSMVISDIGVKRANRCVNR